MKKKQAAYNAKTIANVGDVTKANLKGLGCDILLFTSPCTSLSPLGKRLGFEEGSNTASSIIWSLKNVLNDLSHQPEIIFFENVKQLVTTYELTFRQLKKYLESEGYFVYSKILDAAKYGIPQHRERVYVIACKRPLDINWPEPTELKFKLKDVLEEKVSEKCYNTGLIEYFKKHSLETNYTFRVFNPSKAEIAHTITCKAGSRISDNFVFDEDVSDDIEVRFKKKNLNMLDEGKLMNTRIRKLSPNETMVLTGLNVDEIERINRVGLSDAQVYKLMGNAVVVDVVEKVFESVLYAYFKQVA